MSGVFTTTGTILHSRVDEYSGPEGGRMFRTRITYEYVVDDTHYVNDRVYPYQPVNRAATPIRRVHEAIVCRYPVGAQVRVYYDPADPQHAYLEPGLSLLRDLVTLPAASLSVG